MNKLKLSIMLGLGLTLSTTTQAELLVVANPAFSDNAVSIEQIREIYQGKLKTLPDGTRVRAVSQPGGSQAREEFLSLVMKQTESEFNRYWSRLIFSGKGRPPEALDTAAAVKTLVARTPGAIGYIDATEVDDTVKVLLRIE